jgi:DNA-binding CsgD family transcriptional regulator
VQSGVASLTEREREVLRLLACGHDTKSSAQALAISIYSVNERLRDARQKLGVSSSREAARIFSAHHQAEDNFLGDKKTGLVEEHGLSADAVASRTRSQEVAWRNWQIAGGFGVLIAIGLSALMAGGTEEAPSPSRGQAAPRIVATAPAAGSVIRPGSFVLSVTFDQPMLEGSYSFVQASPDTYPQCGGKPTLSKDRKTFSVLCTALPNRRFEVWFNRQPYMNFVSEDGVPAEPFQLLFRSLP